MFGSGPRLICGDPWAGFVEVGDKVLVAGCTVVAVLVEIDGAKSVAGLVTGVVKALTVGYAAGLA
jgi:acyl-[acyl carrier protein]--UDP-N-acetylglucosamine O-acyltransferase